MTSRVSPRSFAMTRRAGAIPAILALVLMGGPVPAPAQEGRFYGADQFFALTWDRAESGGQPAIAGYVTNLYGLEATHVRLVVESLDASGAVVARTIGHVNYPIPPSGRMFFEVSLPAAAPRHDVFVLSWSWRRSPSG
jgi:hypothetical protein